MSNKKNYPLHPGQTHIEPNYTQVPTEEYEALKREVKQLREISAGARTTIDDIAEIKTLTSEVNALREMNAKAQEEIATLKENQRWRKFSEEKPEEKQWILVYYGYENNGCRIEVRRWDDGCKYDVEFQELYTHWMPLPSAPKEER